MTEGSPPDTDLYRRVVQLFGVLCFGLVAVETAAGIPPQDGATYVAAGQLALEGQWDAIYPVMRDAPSADPAYVERYCALVRGASQPCETFMVPFISPPPMLALSVPFALVGDFATNLLLRLSGALACAWGGLRLWEEVSRRSPAMTRPLALSLILLFPLAQNSIEKAQTAPWLFAALVAGWLWTDRRGAEAAGLGAILVGCTLAKLSPILFGAVLLFRRQWVAAAAMAAGLVLTGAYALWLVPVELWQAHAHFMGGFSAWVPSYASNTSVEAAWYQLTLAVTGGPVGVAVVSRVKVALLAALGAWLAWKVPDRRLWPLAWMVWLVVLPVNWAHYNFVAVGAVALLAGPMVRSETGGWLLGAWLVGATALLQLLTLDGVGPILGGAWLVGSLGLCVAGALRAPEEPT